MHRVNLFVVSKKKGKWTTCSVELVFVCILCSIIWLHQHPLFYCWTINPLINRCTHTTKTATKWRKKVKKKFSWLRMLMKRFSNECISNITSLISLLVVVVFFSPYRFCLLPLRVQLFLTNMPMFCLNGTQTESKNFIQFRIVFHFFH